MKLFVWIIMITTFLYTMGFSINLWKSKNKVGSIGVFLLAIAVVIAPFLSVYLRN